MDIEPGTIVAAKTALGTEVTMRAITGPTAGVDFAVIWLVREEAFEAGDDTNATPWPVDDVRALADV